jgi:hypothetical protein
MARVKVMSECVGPWRVGPWRIGPWLWSVASLATSGCFLVGSYELSEKLEATQPNTPDDNETGTNGEVDPELSPMTSVDTAMEADASAVVDPSAETATGVVTSTIASTASATQPTDSTQRSSTHDELSTNEEGATSTPESTVTSPTTAPASDAGATSEPETTEPPVCPDGTTYDSTSELCVFDCGEDGQRAPSGRCYWVGGEGTERPWSEVPDLCAERGEDWTVLTIRSSDENDFVISILQGDTWLGASDEKMPDRWLWLDDNTAFWQGRASGRALDGHFELWGTGEPSGTLEEECARYVSDDGTDWSWSDCPCGRVGGVWGGPGEIVPDVYYPGCKGPTPLAPE